MNLRGNFNDVEPEIENKTGITGQTPIWTAKEYTGFSFNQNYSLNVIPTEIAGNGSTIVKLYYI